MLVEYYYSLYLFVLTILCFNCFAKYNGRDGGVTYIENSNATRWLLLVVCLYIGLRPVDGPGVAKAFGDTVVYTAHYKNLIGIPFDFSMDVENLLFDNLFNFWAANDLGITSFYLLFSFIYFFAAYIAIKKMFPSNVFAVMLVFLTAFSTYSASVNGIKAGAAGSLFILALAYRTNLYAAIPLVLLSFGIHHSMQVLMVAFVCTLLYNKPKWYYVFWLICLVLSFLHISYFQVLFASYTDEKGAGYLLYDGSDWGGKSAGFRLDFVIYSAMPILMGWYSIYKRKIVNKLYNVMLCTYILVNAIWLLCMYAQFTNRIAYLSWFLYPIVLVDTCFDSNFGSDRYRFFAKIAALHLAFTLFMHIIYY